MLVFMIIQIKLNLERLVMLALTDLATESKYKVNGSSVWDVGFFFQAVLKLQSYVKLCGQSIY